jgi:hypothetical protein
VVEREEEEEEEEILTDVTPLSSSSSSSSSSSTSSSSSSSAMSRENELADVNHKKDKQENEKEKDKSSETEEARINQRKKMEMLSTPPPSRKKPSVRLTSDVREAIEVNTIPLEKNKELEATEVVASEGNDDADKLLKKVYSTRATSLAWSTAAESLSSGSAMIHSPQVSVPISNSENSRIKEEFIRENEQQEDSEEIEDGDPEEEEAERVEATAVWLQCARSKTLALLAGLKALMTERVYEASVSHSGVAKASSVHIERVISQLTELCAFSTVFNSNATPTSPPPSFGRRGRRGSVGFKNIKLEAKAWLESNSQLVLAGLNGIDQLSPEERSAVVTAVSQVATATAALSNYITLLTSSFSPVVSTSPSSLSVEPFTEEDEAQFKKELLSSAVGPLCKGFLGSSLFTKNVDKSKPILPILV